MSTSYTEEEMAKAMQELHIAPVDGKVDGREAAKIMTWRAQQEFYTSYQYTPTSVRLHVRAGNISANDIDTTNPRRSRYAYRVIFSLPLAPARGAGRRSVKKSSADR